MAAPPPMFIVKCECGWTETFSRGYSGLVIECPRCGKNHRIPTMAGSGDLDPAEVQRIMAHMSGPRASVNLRPMFIASAVVTAAAVVAALAFFHDRFYPMGVVIIGGALSWPLGLWVAWLGQRRQIKKQAGRE